MKILLFTGYAGSGKTTAAQMVGRGINSTRHLSLATPLREVCAAAFPFVPRKCFYGSKAEKEAEIPGMPGWSGRRVLQHIGTEGFRVIDPDIWVNKVIYSLEQRDLARDISYNASTVDDIRFPNEAVGLRHYGKLYRVDRRNNPGAAGPAHESEKYIDTLDVDGVIDNNGSLEDLELQIREIVGNL